MADEDEVEVTSGELSSLGGTVENYVIPDETMQKVEATEDVRPVEASDEESTS